MGVIVQRGLPQDQRRAAAVLYWQAFGGKLGRVLGPDARALDFLERVIRADHAIVALQEGRIVGLAGFKTPYGAFAGGSMADLRLIYGTLGSLWRASATLGAMPKPILKPPLAMNARAGPAMRPASVRASGRGGGCRPSGRSPGHRPGRAGRRGRGRGCRQAGRRWRWGRSSRFRGGADGGGAIGMGHDVQASAKSWGRSRASCCRRRACPLTLRADGLGSAAEVDQALVAGGPEGGADGAWIARVDLAPCARMAAVRAAQARRGVDARAVSVSWMSQPWGCGVPMPRRWRG
jgi:hypothetical protein